MSRLVFPGEDVSSALLSVASGVASSASSPAPLRLGAGLLAAGDDADDDASASAAGEGAGGAVLATRVGLLSHKAPSRFYVLSNLRRYYPAVGDSVVGVVTERNAEAYRVQLRGTAAALLPVLAFDGASKRNKPNLAVGALVFARVAAVDKHLDVELTCQAATGGIRKDWMTGQSVYGELKEGTIATVGLAHARRLLQPQCALLSVFGESIPFEVAIGMNGLVYVRADTIRHTTIIANAVERSERLTEEDSATFARRLAASAAAAAE